MTAKNAILIREATKRGQRHNHMPSITESYLPPQLLVFSMIPQIEKQILPVATCLIHEVYGRPLLQMDTLLLACKKHRQDNLDKNGRLGPDELSRGFLPKRKQTCHDFESSLSLAHVFMFLGCSVIGMHACSNRLCP